jgi:alkanesulfonate monooxygenase SsuD/methylene tetrahydromethanopterin reductase-like flavin-dependent oxidoreductase (luciferase family)
MSAGKSLSSAICRIGRDVPPAKRRCQRVLSLIHLDKLGYDEFWCGEHHSSGWEMIGSPEMRLDYMTGGRVIFGSGPGALASDAHTLGIDPMLLRDRQDEAIGVIRRLMRGERLTVRDGEDHREPGRGRRPRSHEIAAAGRLGQQHARSEPGPRPRRVAVTTWTTSTTSAATRPIGRASAAMTATGSPSDVVKDWRGLAAKHAQAPRQLLRKLLVGRITRPWSNDHVDLEPD